MPVTKTSTFLQSSFTQASLIDQIKTDLIALGFSFVEDYAATDRLIVFSFVYDAAKVFGTLFLRIRITASLGVLQTIGTAWNTTTKALANESTTPGSIAFVSTSPLELVSYSKNPGVKILQLSQGLTTTVFLGLFRPESKPAWWNEDTHPYAFSPNANAWSILYTSTLNPFANASNSIAFSTNLSGTNAFTSKRDVVAGLTLVNASSNGISGKTSTDIGIAASTGLAKLDTLEVQAGVEEYALLYAGNNGVVLRTV